MRKDANLEIRETAPENRHKKKGILRKDANVEIRKTSPENRHKKKGKLRKDANVEIREAAWIRDSSHANRHK